MELSKVTSPSQARIWPKHFTQLVVSADAVGTIITERPPHRCPSPSCPAYEPNSNDVPTHRQVNIPTSPVGMETRRRLRT